MTARRTIPVAVILGLWFVLWFSTSSFAQGTLYTLVTNGPTAKRINVVVLAEGYTTNQTNLFLTDAINAFNNLLAQPPYQEYKNYFNGFAIFVASVESGSDHPISGTLKNTYFNSSFDTYGIPQLLTIPPNVFDSNAANGQGKVDALLATLMPEHDLTVMVVNDLEYGGSGGQTLITSVNVLSPEIIVHESGHAFGGLADEYTNAFPGFVPVEMPNATAITNRASAKWTSWILGSTPIPTPQDSSNAAVVGLFQGAEYQTSGWYRPKLDCKMNHPFVNFCEVCSEKLVKSIYTQVRPIQFFMPTATNLTLFNTQAVAFSVTPLQPLTHNLAIQWFTNDTGIADATNATFILQPGSLGNGLHTLKAVVSDPTALVKTDPTGLLKSTNTWNLSVSLNNLALVSAQYLSSNRFRVTVTGTAPAGFVIQASTNFVNWSPLTTNSLSSGKFDYTNANLTNFTFRFYRTVSPP